MARWARSWWRCGAQEGTAARALELLILTATRTSETILARWEEFDVEQGTWTIPAERMKAGKGIGCRYP